MFVAQLGHFAWLSWVVPVTTSADHATHFATEAEAAQAVAGFKATRQQCLAHLQGAQRIYYEDKEPEIVPLADLRARMAWKKERGRMCLPEFVPVAGEQPTPADPVAADTPGTEQVATAAPKPKADPAAPKRPGVTKAIYQWVLDNPQATKKDAQAAFPDANPSTVGVQFGAARKAGA